MLDTKQLTHLKQLEAESIHIIREVVAEFDNPVMMYSVGKDSAVMLHLALKAFAPAKLPFPLLHVDTLWKFKEMIAFRDKRAKEEGFDHIAYLFEEVGKIEKEHEERYLKLLENLKDGKVFEAGEVKVWKCRNCGHIVVGTKAPEVCPVCSHPKAYFEIKAENY